MEEGLVCRLKLSFEILSEKYMANRCCRVDRGDDVGRERCAVLCILLLIVYQRARGLNEEDWTNAA